MIRAARLAVSRPMYAFAPETFAPRPWSTDGPSADGLYRGARGVNAVWFKRKSGVLTATLGTYGLFLLPRGPGATSDTYEAWVDAHTDNRYGAAHVASWDGTRLIGGGVPAVDAERVAFLQGMLDGFPSVPVGFDGWWTFERPAR